MQAQAASSKILSIFGRVFQPNGWLSPRPRILVPILLCLALVSSTPFIQRSLSQARATVDQSFYSPTALAQIGLTPSTPASLGPASQTPNERYTRDMKGKGKGRSRADDDSPPVFPPLGFSPPATISSPSSDLPDIGVPGSSKVVAFSHSVTQLARPSFLPIDQKMRAAGRLLGVYNLPNAPGFPQVGLGIAHNFRSSKPLIQVLTEPRKTPEPKETTEPTKNRVQSVPEPQAESNYHSASSPAEATTNLPSLLPPRKLGEGYYVDCNEGTVPESFHTDPTRSSLSISGGALHLNLSPSVLEVLRKSQPVICGLIWFLEFIPIQYIPDRLRSTHRALEFLFGLIHQFIIKCQTATQDDPGNGVIMTVTPYFNVNFERWKLNEVPGAPRATGGQAPFQHETYDTTPGETQRGPIEGKASGESVPEPKAYTSQKPHHRPHV